MRMPAQKRHTRTKGAQRLFAAAMLAASLAACSSADDAVEDLVGTWVAPNGPTWEVADGSISVLRDGEVVVVSTYTATSTTIEMVDTSGPRACSSDQIGTYEWEIDNNVLSLTAVSDGCTGRRGVLDGISFEQDE